MARTKGPITEPVEAPRRANRPTPPEEEVQRPRRTAIKHIPGFVQSPPDHCTFETHNRGVEVIDVLLCASNCRDKSCPAYRKYLEGARRLDNYKKREWEDD